MIYNTGNGASIQKLPDKSQILGKRQWILLLEIEKKESKTRNTFQKLLEQISQTPQYNQNRQGQGSTEKMFMRKLPRNSQTYLEILVPYLNNSSEETIFGSNEFKEQHTTMKVHLKP